MWEGLVRERPGELRSLSQLRVDFYIPHENGDSIVKGGYYYQFKERQCPPGELM